MRNTLKLVLAAATAATLAMPGSQAGELAPVLVLTDPNLDNLTEENDTPLGAASDLVAGYIGETDTSIDLTWQVANLEPLLEGAPINTLHYWEFGLTNPDGKSALFSVRARMFPTPVSTANPTGTPNPTWPTGQLQSNCVTANNVVTCSSVPGAVVTITIDSENDQITASVRREDLKATTGEALAVDGATLTEAVLFNGISTCVSFVAATSAAACDGGDLDLGAYTLGSPRE
jgi:hypothetical protein